ncbi:MAG: hypothetical protein DWQ02_07360 [Bacteroidetes bacterium]|nr:MAG: hypothetical protein DWQ02_07360 [Bacteroidota bacterium]
MTLQSCKVQNAGIFGKRNQVVSYEKDILPLMERSCTPCHFPDQGRVKMLDTHEATKANVNGILYRVQLPSDDENFMPFKNKREPFSAEEVALFKKWMEQGMPE